MASPLTLHRHHQGRQTLKGMAPTNLVSNEKWGMSTWRPLMELSSWCTTFKLSHCNSFEDWASVDEIYGCPIFKWDSWLHNRIPAMAVKRHGLFCVITCQICVRDPFLMLSIPVAFCLALSCLEMLIFASCVSYWIVCVYQMITNKYLHLYMIIIK